MKTQVIKADKPPHLLKWVLIAGIAIILILVDTIVPIAGMAGWDPFFR